MRPYEYRRPSSSRRRSHPEVTRRLRVSRKSAYQWRQLRQDGSVEALASWRERVAVPPVPALSDQTDHVPR
jgi:hypothetical protein